MEIACPVRSVDFPGLSDIELKGLIVVIGPNSSGKTQLLRDLNEAVCGRPRQFVVASAILYNKPPPFDNYFDHLVRTGTISESSDNTFTKHSFQYGADEGAGSFHKSTVQSHYSKFSQAAEGKIAGSVPEYIFLKELGALSCSALFLQNRLSLMDPCKNFDYRRESPIKTLQSLYWSKTAKRELYEEIVRVFKRAVWVDSTCHTQLLLRVADGTELPPPEDRLEPEVMEQYRTIETEGDGLRSYCAICATLLLAQRPLCLVDEPEMCLHPPQAHSMGRFMGRHATLETCTVVATHSSYVLRGILETNPQARIIRLMRSAHGFHARCISSGALEQATSKPRSRSENILEGLLSDAVVLCEAEGDRVVYESVYRTLKDRTLDVRFVPSEGTGGFTDPLELYRALGVPTAVVADLDFLAKVGELARVLTHLVPEESVAQQLRVQARTCLARMKKCIPQAEPTSVQEELACLASEAKDPTKGEPDRLRRELLELADRLYSLHQLKMSGIEAVPCECKDETGTVKLRDDMTALLSNLEKIGLFLVPIGELESWLPILMKGQSRQDKSRWAMLAAEKIDNVGEREDVLWLFLRRIHNSLVERVDSLFEVLEGKSL